MNDETRTVTLWFENNEYHYYNICGKMDDLLDEYDDIEEVRTYLEEWLVANYGEVIRALPDYQRELLQKALDEVEWGYIAAHFTLIKE